MNWDAIFAGFEHLPVLVIGDVMLDRYVYGQVSRISPEAPVPVVEWRGQEDRPGGAANVAINLQTMGANPLLIGVVGADDSGEALLRALKLWHLQDDGLLISQRRQTTTKSRIMGGHQQLLRLDREDTFELDKGEQNELLACVLRLIDRHQPRVAILQDYDKGLFSLQLIENLLGLLKDRGIAVCVDPKRRNFWHYCGADLFKPNWREVTEALGWNPDTSEGRIGEAAAIVAERLSCRRCMITLSERGLWLQENGAGRLYPTVPRSVADVSGAGDTVVSVAALGLALDLPSDALATLANMAGSQVVEKAGVVPVDREQLLEELKRKDELFPQH